MTKEMGGFIGKCLGGLVDIDVGVTGECFGKYMRIRVAIDVSKPLKRFLRLEFKQGVESMVLVRYERLPEYCFHCGIIGHSYQVCQARTGNDSFVSEKGFEYGPWLRGTSASGQNKGVIQRRSSGEDSTHRALKGVFVEDRQNKGVQLESRSRFQSTKEYEAVPCSQSVVVEDVLQVRDGVQGGDIGSAEKMQEELLGIRVSEALGPVDSISSERVDKNSLIDATGIEGQHARFVMNTSDCPPLILMDVQVDADFQFLAGGSVSGLWGSANVVGKSVEIAKKKGKWKR